MASGTERDGGLGVSWGRNDRHPDAFKMIYRRQEHEHAGDGVGRIRPHFIPLM